MQLLSAAEPLVKGPTESILMGMDFTQFGLPSAVTLSTVASVVPSPLTGGPSFGSLAVNAATFLNGKGGTVAIGKGAQFRATGGTIDTDYVITVTVTTSDGNTLTGVGTILCRDR